MVNLLSLLRLLSVPLLWMGVVQLLFGALSHFFFKDDCVIAFIEPAIPMMLIALLLIILLWREHMPAVSYRDALVFASLTWVVTGLLGAIPVMLVTGVHFTDAAFESISALTTTGATILSGLDSMPPSFLLYRQFLQWMGGLGVVIFVVAVLPMLNVGGMRLLKAETPGPVKDDKLSPRIANTAHYLWIVYLLLTVLCAGAYYWGGMSAYDALAHSFTTVSTGGFSTHDASMWYFESHSLLAIANVFMLLGAINFALHFRFLQSRQAALYARDEETRVFLLIVLVVGVGLALYLFSQSHYASLEALSFSFFHVISFMTSTGYGAADLGAWPPGSDMLLITVAYLGGCAGSTAGGNKVIRDIIAFRLVQKNFKTITHPHAIITLHYNKRPLDAAILGSVMGFLFFVAASSLGFTVILVATGLDLWSAFTAVAACINVLGPGFGEVGSNFQAVSDVGTWVLSAAMIIGRLEYFTVFAILLPAFWRY